MKMRAAVVVLGDIGRSPRMKFHALSLAAHNCRVDLIGYQHSTPHSILSNNQRIRIVGIWEPPDWLKYLPKTLAYAMKFLWSSLLLFMTLMFRITFPRIILLQNPPGIPTMLVCWIVCRIKGARLVVDWHNYTCSILEWTHGSKSWLVKRAEAWERFFGPKADLSLCVTHAMRSDLYKRWNVRAVTLYDRPPTDLFKALTLRERHNFYSKMANRWLYRCFMAEKDGREWVKENELTNAEDVTRFSYVDSGSVEPEVKLRSDRPALIVSGTSWTEDEDFSILLNALERYDSMATLEESEKSDQLPRILAVITGKGPMKAYYTDLIKEKQLTMVEFLTPWLEAEDYSKILGSADLGVSLHMSTSGLDLPMKVVDMFGSGLPVLAKKFPCLDELVKEGENGQSFNTETELADWLVSLLRGFSSGNNRKLENLRQNLRDSPLVNWEDNWDATVWPLLEPLE